MRTFYSSHAELQASVRSEKRRCCDPAAELSILLRLVYDTAALQLFVVHLPPLEKKEPPEPLRSGDPYVCSNE